MPTPPYLEDPSYAGRGGGYVTRITGKLLHEAATGGRRQLFLPMPQRPPPYRVYGGSDAKALPLYEVPPEFYEALFSRIEALFAIEKGSPSAERTFDYDGVSYRFLLERVSDSDCGMVLSILPSETSRVST